MTTPNQLPIDRAFVVGGTTVDPSTTTSYDATSFGQDFTDSAIRALFEIPTLTLGNALEVFTSLLLKLPLEALQVLGGLVPGGLDGFTDVVGAVDAIVGSLTDAIKYLAEGDFEGFIDALLSALGIDGSGTILDKIFDLADGFDEWFGDFDGLLGSFDDLLGILGGSGGSVEGAANFITNFLSILGIGDISSLTGSTGSFNPTTILQNFVTGKLNPLSLLEDDGIRDFFKQLLDTLTSILRLIPFVGNSIADSIDNLADGMEAQTDTVIGTAAQTSQIMAALGTGVPDADDFERSTLGSNWRVIKSNGGTVAVDGHNLVMTHTADTDFVLLKTDKVGGSDAQTVEFVLGSAPGFGTVVLDSARGHNDGWIRCSDFTTWASRTGIRIRWSGQNKNIKLSGFVSGSEAVTIFDAAVSTASAGSKLSLEAIGSTRHFIIRINGSIISGGDVVESGTASQVGASYRTRGIGGATEHLGIDPFGISPDPGTVKQWTATG